MCCLLVTDPNQTHAECVTSLYASSWQYLDLRLQQKMQLEGEPLLHAAAGERGYQALKEYAALARSDHTVKVIV